MAEPTNDIKQNSSQDDSDKKEEEDFPFCESKIMSVEGVLESSNNETPVFDIEPASSVKSERVLSFSCSIPSQVEKVSSGDKAFMQLQPLHLAQDQQFSFDPKIYKTEALLMGKHTQTRFLEPEVFAPTVKSNPIGNGLFNKAPNMKTTIEISEVLKIPLKRTHSQSERANSLVVEKGKQYSIGRSKLGSFVLSDQIKSISSQHANIQYDDRTDSWMLDDTSSTNGSFVIQKEIPLQKDLILLVGTFECTVTQLEFSDHNSSSSSSSNSSNSSYHRVRIELSFKNVVDDGIPSFMISFELADDAETVYRIGRLGQPGFEKDKSIHDEHFTICKENQNIVLKNIDGVYHQVGIRILPSKRWKITQEMVVKFGLINKYRLTIKQELIQNLPQTETKNHKMMMNKMEQGSQASKKQQTSESSEKECLLCKQQCATIYYFEPCMHKSFCLNCILNKAKNECLTCKQPYTDFQSYVTS